MNHDQLILGIPLGAFMSLRPSIALSYFEEAQKISSDFNSNFKRITGDDTHVQKGLDFINLDEMVRFDIAKLKEPTRQLIESAKY